MNPFVITALVVLAIAATAQYFLGTKKNRVIASRIANGAEEVLKPSSTNYVNIGSTIGHNFAYVLSGDWASAKGTFTLRPRHSLLYLPFSWLLGVSDRFYINLFTKKKIRGEGHVVALSQLKRAKIEGIEGMERVEVEAGGERFALLWRGANLSAELQALLDAMPDPKRLRHFCAYPDNKTFFLHTLPRQGDVKEDLIAMLGCLPRFMEKAKE